MAEHTTERLADLIGKRHRCLLQLRDLGSKQAELIETGEMGPLLRLIAAKNQIIVALQAVEQELAPFDQQDPDQRDWSSAAARQDCAEQAASCQQLLAEIMQMERDNEQRMTERRDQVALQLQAVQSASAARGAYQAQQTARPRTDSSHSSTAPTNVAFNGGHRLDVQSEA